MSDLSELNLLRRVASAARWAIDANKDNSVGRDGRSRIGINWVMAQGELARALESYEATYQIKDVFKKKRKYAAEVERQLRLKKRA